MPRRILLIGVLAAALAACSSTSASPAASSAAASVDPDAIELSVMDFMLDQPDLEVTGPTVTLIVTNEGPTPHNVAVRTEAGEVLMTTADLSRGETETITAELPPGDYITFCSLAGHESLGIKGTLTVSAP
jgi:plastocyanin